MRDITSASDDILHNHEILGGVASPHTDDLYDVVHGTDGNDFFHTQGDGRIAPPGYNDVLLTDFPDTIYTGAGDDIIFCDRGNDTINFGANLTTRDKVDGGAFPSSIILDGDYSTRLALTAHVITNIQEIDVAAGHSYNLHFDDAVANNVPFYFKIDGSGLGAGDSLTVNATEEQTVPYFIFSGGGNDDLTGGQGSDVIEGGGGDDRINGSGGNDQLLDYDPFTYDSGNDVLIGGAGNDSLGFGDGNDVASGGTGDDYIGFFGDMNSADRIDGGLGHDVVDLTSANYFAQVRLNADWMVGIEGIAFHNGEIANPTYNFAVDDNFLSAGQTFTVDCTGLSFLSTVEFDGSAETDASFKFAGYWDTDIFTGGAKDDLFTFPGDFSGNDFPTGFAATDQLDGGTGRDTLILDGAGYADGIVFESTTIRNIEIIFLGDNQDHGGCYQHYKFILDDGNVAAGHTLSLRAQYLNQYGGVIFDGSHETDGNFSLLGGAGADTLIGGAQADSIKGGAGDDTVQGGLGADKLDGGDGADIFVYSSVLESTSRGFDRLSHFDAANDAFDLPFSVTAIDATVMGGKLSNSGHFDALLGAAVGPDQLAANHAVLFMPDAGTLRGDIFLVVDGNGVAGYQSGQDLVVLLSSPADLASLSASNFT